MLVCTRGAAFEMDLWKFWGVAVDDDDDDELEFNDASTLLGH